MEVSIFPKFKGLLAKRYVEVHLDTDPGNGDEQRARNEAHRQLQVKLTDSVTRPTYVVLDPAKPDEPLGIFEGADLSGASFGRFLEKYAQQG